MALQPPPFTQNPIDRDGRFVPVWREFFLDTQVQVVTGTAPNDARYVTTTANASLTNLINLGLLTSGPLRIGVALGIATVSSTVPAATLSTPANPTGTANTTGTMMGVAGTITPVTSGRVLITVCGTIFNATAIADGAKAQIRTGTGAAPANGSALTGTAVGSLAQYIAATVAEMAPFALTALVTGLTLNTAVWIDLGLAAITGGTASVSDLAITAVEV